VGEQVPLFVYGSLRRGHAGHPVLSSTGATFLGTGTVAGRVGEQKGHPALRLDATAATTPGELWALPEPADAALATLDAYEDFRGHGAPGSLYHRALARITPEPAGLPRLAWLYVGASR
jgi:gamma-glutamylcyclotransferase (GGCT)/AIG2-like uncharacterized protein YtfP